MKALNELKSERFLEKEGFLIAKRAVIKNKEELNTLKSWRFPVVLKINPIIPIHKKQIGGVIICKNAKETEKAFRKLMKIAKKHKNLKIKSILVHQFIRGKKFMLGIKKDSVFGHVLLFGIPKNDILEKEKTIFKIIPISESEIKSLADSKEIIKTIKKLQILVRKYPKIKELDLSPLILSKNKMFTVDARIIFD